MRRGSTGKDAWKVGKVGKVAGRMGLSVRTLHHYDEIGLLSSSRRTEAGQPVLCGGRTPATRAYMG